MSKLIGKTSLVAKQSYCPTNIIVMIFNEAKICLVKGTNAHNMMLSKKNLFIHQVGLKLILYQKTLHVTLENEKGARADGDWRVEERGDETRVTRPELQD